MAIDQAHEEDVEMSFFDHLDTLRKHLIRSAYAVVGLSILSFIYIDFLFHTVIMGPLRTDFITYNLMCDFSRQVYADDRLCIGQLNFVLQNTEMAGQFIMSFKLAFTAGIILAMPVILFQLWLFIRPALTTKERKNTSGFVFYSSFLFFSGVFFGYYILSPISVNFLSGFSLSDLIKNEININNMFSFLTLVILGSGLIFELPVVMYFLARIGLISSGFLKKYRKHAFIVILIIAALATPPDVVSQVVMTIPLYSLFELGILIVKKVEKRKQTEHG